MAFTKFKKLILNGGDVVTSYHLQQVQANIDQALLVIGNSPFFRGNFVDVTLAFGIDNIVNHGLGRKVQGWTIVDKNAQADIWQSNVNNTLPESQILLRSSALVTAKIYFY